MLLMLRKLQAREQKKPKIKMEVITSLKAIGGSVRLAIPIHSEVLEEDDEEYKSERENKAHLNRIRDKMYATQPAPRAAYMSVPFKERKVQDVLQ